MIQKITKFNFDGGHYKPDLPCVLQEYAAANPYLDISSTYTIAAIFGVSRQTISNWMKAHPEFKQAVCELRTHTLNRVESAMMQRILGYTVKETKTVKTGEETTVQTIEKEIPPDPALIRYYLEHRAPSRWAEEKPAEMPKVDLEDDTLLIDAEDRPEDVA